MKSLYLFIFCLLMSVSTFSQKAENDTLSLSKQFEQYTGDRALTKILRLLERPPFKI